METTQLLFQIPGLPGFSGIFLHFFQKNKSITEEFKEFQGQLAK